VNERVVVLVLRVLMTVLLLVLPAAAQVPNVPPPGMWAQVPNSVLHSVMPPEAKVASRPGDKPELWNPSSIMAAWSGGDVAQVGGVWGFLIWGGGHGDGPDNSLYFIPFDGSGPRSLMGPYLAPPGVGYFDQGAVQDAYAGVSRNQPSNTAPGQAPKASHTYSSILALRDRNLAWKYGGSITSGSGGGTAATRAFDLAQTKAQAMARPDMGWTFLGYAPAPSVASSSGYDEKKRVIVTRGATFWGLYNPDTNKWTRLADAGGGSDYSASVAVDSVGRKMWALGGRIGEVIDLDSYAVTTFYSQTVDWSQPTAPSVMKARPGYEWVTKLPFPSGAPGVAWHPTRKRLLFQAGQDVLSVDPATKMVTRLAMGGATVSPMAANGTFGRFRLIPGTDIIATVSDVAQPVFIGTLPNE